MRRDRSSLGLASLVLVSAACGSQPSTSSVQAAAEAGTPPAPSYSRSRSDAVTGALSPIVITGSPPNCPPSSPCFVPPAGSDSYRDDLYERPAGRGSLASNYYPAIDIVSADFGLTSTWLFYRLNVFGPDSGQPGSPASLPYFYSVEANFDADPAGDAVIELTAPSVNLGNTWSTAALVVRSDGNNTIGNPRVFVADGPNAANGGYETKVFDSGVNTAPGGEGGTTAVQARVTGNAIEIAVYRPFLESLTSDTVAGAAFRPYASRAAIDASRFTTHDDRGRNTLGSPYPWLQTAGAPSSCPNGPNGDDNLTSAQIVSLESGTRLDTGITNPCYARPAGLYEFDSAGTVASLADKDDVTFDVDLRLTISDAPDPVVAGSPLTYTLAVQNAAPPPGQASNVVVVDNLPASVTFVSASPGCTHAAGVATCVIGTLANGSATAVQIVVTPNVPGAISNTATVTSDADDTDPSNDTDTEQTAVLAVCGNGITELGEVCDDGNQIPNDGCESDCKRSNGEACSGGGECESGICFANTCRPANTCGNGVQESGEACDDGNATPSDGCEADCKLSNGQTCNVNGECESSICFASTCRPANTCGNGLVEGSEVCDDGNAIGGDGCENDCKLSNGQACGDDDDCESGLCNGTCRPTNTCGNGVLEGAEVCDDGNAINGDGCEIDCKRSNGATCTGDTECSSSTCDVDHCEPDNTCGNGDVEGAEACDDGNTTDGDGCNNVCLREDGEACTSAAQCASGVCDGQCGGADTDRDGVFDIYDLDDDNDGLLDSVEGTRDSDGDGVRDSLDLDSDNDGISDTYEAGHFKLAAANGRVDCPEGFGTNGFCNGLETGIDSGIATTTVLANHDGDATPDYLDLDSDNDGLSDLVEGGSGCADANDDGVCDVPNVIAGHPPTDTDGDLAIDAHDLDSDNDGLWDIEESKQAELDKTRDGVIDVVTDGDDDGIRDPADDSALLGGLHDARVYSDDDALPDFQDPDGDGDGVAAGDNCPKTFNPDQRDTDADRIGNACDDSDDRIGVAGGGCSTGGGTSIAFVLALLAVLVPRRRAALVALAIAIPATSRAQVVEAELNVERFQIASDADGIIDIEGARVRPHLGVDVALWAGYANDPLTLYRFGAGGRERAGSLVKNQVDGELVIAFGMLGKLQAGLGLPLIFSQTDDVDLGMPSGPGSSFAVGDLRLLLKGQLLTQARHGVDLALLAAVTFPTSSGDGFNGDTWLTAAPTVAVSRTFIPGVRAAANLGYRAREQREMTGLEINDELFASIGGGYTLPRSTLELALAFSYATPAGDAFGAFNRNYAEIKPGMSWDFEGPLAGFLVTGFGVAEGYGTPDWRILAGVRFDSTAPEPPRAPRDPDRDGIFDAADKCPSAPEDADGFEDEDGCPDLDDDHDGIPDAQDKCPREPEDHDAFEDSDGCPELDNDRDKVPDATDKCPTVAEDFDGFEDQDGCPEVDNDRDGVMDGDDACPIVAGTAANKGCPMVDRDNDTVEDAQDNCPDWPGKPSFLGCNGPQLVKISTTKLELLDTVQFAKGARIDRKSFKLLDAAVFVLKNHREVKVELQGQPEDKLFAVKAYLVKKGIAPDRMTVKPGTSSTNVEIVIVPATKP